MLFIWLRGANDALNSVIPIMDSAYSSSRPTLAIPQDPGTSYLTAGPADFPEAGNTGSTYGAYPYGVRLGNGFAALHPSLKFLAPVYNAGDLALIHRVAYPKQSQSHFDSQRYWENGVPNNNLVSEGIFYRTMLEYLIDQGASASPLTGVSIQSSLPLILRGSDAPMTNLTDPLRYDLLGIPNSTNGNLKATAFLNSANTYPFPSKQNRGLLELQYQNLMGTLNIFAGIDFTENGNTYRDDAVTDGDQQWYDGNGSQGYYLFPTNSDKNGGWRRPDGSAVFNKYAVPTSLHSLFERIKAAAIILNKTDAIIAGTEYGGFDTHNNQVGAKPVIGQHANLLGRIGWAMYALRKYFTLYSDQAKWENLAVVTLSEFGRTTIQNTSMGTDHAEAGVMFVAGGAVRGYGKGNPTGVFGCSPSDAVPWAPGAATGTTGSMFGVSGRYLKRAYDYRSVLGKLIRDHLGATQNQLNRVIPGYLVGGEHLLGGGTSMDGTPIMGEPNIV